jgi:VCBS repeat-containing protein
LNSGGRYNPDTDSWTPTSTTNAPLAALYPTGVWTGVEMIVWGGICDDNTITCPTDSFEGGRYDPLSDSWTPTTLAGVPEARSYHTAVWTGESMIVYGGIGTFNGFRHTGGVYYATAPANQDPTANDDGYTAVAGETLIIDAPGVLANDCDPEDGQLTALLTTTTSNGSLVLLGDGSFTYTPDNDFAGTDTFTYTASDILGGTDTATVTITVNEEEEFTIYLPVVLK